MTMKPGELSNIWEKPLSEWTNEELDDSLKVYVDLRRSWKVIFPDDRDDMGISKMIREIETEIIERTLLSDGSKK